MAKPQKTTSKKGITIRDLSSRKEKLSRRKKPKQPVFWLGLESANRVVLFPIKVNPQMLTFRLAVSSEGSPTPTPSPTPTQPTVLGGRGKKKQTITDDGEVNDDTPQPTPTPTPEP